GAELRAPRARREIGVGLPVGEPLARTVDADLRARLLPVEGETRVGVLGQLRGLAAPIVRENAETTGVDDLHQDEANARPSVRTGRGERGARRLEGGAFQRARELFVEE